MKHVRIESEIGSPRYDRWRNEIILDFGDYTFTRNELNDMGIGMHCVAAKRLHNILNTTRNRADRTVHHLYTLGMKACFQLEGVGETSLIVLAYCIAAARDSYDVMKWIGESGRSVRGAVRTANAKKARP
jgi:hypothetical protein